MRQPIQSMPMLAASVGIIISDHEKRPTVKTGVRQLLISGLRASTEAMLCLIR